jgi:tetratricopeptide (TPR) repeat protein
MIGSTPSPLDRPRRPSGPAKGITAADQVALGDALRGGGELDAALAAYKRALGMLGSAASSERAVIYVRLGQLKQTQDKRREAIANFDKALSLFPPLEADAPMPPVQREAMEARLDLNVAEGDHKAVAAAEDALLAVIPAADRYRRLVDFGVRWQDDAKDSVRARAAFERALSMDPDDVKVLTRLLAIYDEAGMTVEVLATGQKVARLTRDPRERAERYFALGKRCAFELHKDELGLELFDLALESDPTMLEPLAIVAKILAERQEWSQLEQAYRRMLERVDKIAAGPVRKEVTFELCRRLGLLFRDHLEDPALGLDAFEDALHAKPNDLPMVLTAIELAKKLGKHDRAARRLVEAAALEPRRVATYHDLFDAFQKLRRPDQAFQAASVTMLLHEAEARERFIFEEHKLESVPKPTYALPTEGWAWLRPHDREVHAEAVLGAVTPAAIAVRLAFLASEGRLPALDPALRQDPERSTVSIVRSFAWASHFLSVPAPAIYLNDDKELTLAAVIAEEPTVMIGAKAQRGRTPSELAFLVGRHLAYHVGPHRLLLYYPSIEDLTTCFLAAIRIVLPEIPAPPSLRNAVADLSRAIALRISEAGRVDLAAAVAAFEAGGSRVRLADWAADVERCATRAGFLLSGDLEVAATLLENEPRAVLDGEEKIADLLAFAVSDEHHALRESLGIAIQP